MFQDTCWYGYSFLFWYVELIPKICPHVSLHSIYFPQKIWNISREQKQLSKMISRPRHSSGGQSPASHRGGRVQTRVWSCGILWWTKVVLGQVFFENFGFPCQSTFHLLLHNHLHYRPRLAQYAWSGRSANSLTNQVIKKQNKIK
jgi:hypothetical protein